MSVDNSEWAEVHDDSAFGDDDIVDTEVSGVSIVPFQGSTSAELDTVQPLNYEEAKELTENIRATADVLYVLVQRAHAGRAWEPLGYSSFESYVKEEFNISRSRAYQLLNQANVIQQIESIAPEGTKVPISEATVRDLKGMMDTLLPSISEATEGMSPEEASTVIEGILSDAREEQRSANEGEGSSYDEEYAADQADRDGFSGGGEFGGGGGQYEGGQNGPVESYSPDDFNEDDVIDLPDVFGFDTGSDPSETRQRLESVYNLYSTLSTLQGMIPADKMVDFIPEERRIQVEASIGPALEWLTSFAEVWRAQEWSGGASEVAENETSDGDQFASQVTDDSNSTDDSVDVFADMR